MAAEPNAIDGERILRVVSVIAAQGAALSVLEERFTESKEVVTRLHIDGDGLLTAIEICNEKGERMRLRYDPPVPYRPADIQVGEVKTIQTTLRVDSADVSLPNRIVIERLADETVSTPAGEFSGCSHFKSTTTSTMDIRIAKISMTEERQQWYHPAAGGMVKEVYRRGPVSFLTWSRPGYVATSTLMAYGKEEADPGNWLGPQVGIEGGARREPDHSPSRTTWLRSGGLILAGVAALTAGIPILAKRAGRRRGRRE